MKLLQILAVLLLLTFQAQAITYYHRDYVDEWWAGKNYTLEYTWRYAKPKIKIDSVKADVYIVPYNCYNREGIKVGGLYDSVTKKIFIFNTLTLNPDFAVAHEVGHFYDFNILGTTPSYTREDFANEYARRVIQWQRPTKKEI